LSNLQAVIKAASPGDKITVRYVCVGNFKIGKKLTLVGKAALGHPRAVLNGNGSGQVLRVNRARVRLVNLKITGGVLSTQGCSSGPDPTGCGGGLAANLGATVTLKDTLVRGNIAAGGSGGGIAIDYLSTVVLNGSSSVSGNSTASNGPEGYGVAGGILVFGGTLILNDTSSVRGNTGGEGGGIDTYEPGSVTLNDSSSITGNSAIGDGGGINLNFNSPVTLNDSAYITGNTADADDFSGGEGGGVFVWCGGILNGAVDGGNLNDNFRGTAVPVEDNITYQC
jgi:hypothetical protein